MIHTASHSAVRSLGDSTIFYDIPYASRAIYTIPYSYSPFQGFAVAVNPFLITSSEKFPVNYLALLHYLRNISSRLEGVYFCIVGFSNPPHRGVPRANRYYGLPDLAVPRSQT
jgi:hypothetical protein